MRKKEEIRDYKMSDGMLVQKADWLNIKAERDLTELADYGVTEDTLTELMAARNVFADMDTDEELMGNMVIATENKNAKRIELLSQVRQIADRARIKFGERSGKFRKFGVDMLTRNNDSDLIRVARRVGRVATEFLADLISEGLTEPMIAAMLATCAEFDDLIDVQIKAIDDRDFAVEERILAGNALYALIVNLAAKGKLCWEEVSEAKYNDYILTSSSGGSSDSGNTVEGTVAAASVVNISATGLTAATILNISNTGNADLKFYFAPDPTDPSGPMEQLVAAGGTLVVQASGLGFNSDTLFTRLNVHNESPQPGSYMIEWE